MNIQLLLDKIYLLESKIGYKGKHTLFKPFKFDSSDPVKVQWAAKLIAQHIGLPQMTFVITYAEQSEKVGGHIQLDNGNDVFIEIANKFKYDCDIVLSILAHEICHKYLHLEKLKCFPEYENEMLTDATTVFTGLGKLSLNGCEKTSVSSNTIGDIRTTNTSTQKVGYMDRQQFAFVYKLMCEMRRIPEKEITYGLTYEASSVINSISNSYSKYFTQKYFNNNYIEDKIIDLVNKEIGETQKNFATLHKDMRIINESILPDRKSVV